MKKRLIYLAALPILALGLASCSGTDYMSHDFDVVIPEKDSKATNEYNLENSKESDEFKKACLEISANAEKDFYNKYSSFVMTRIIETSTTSSGNNQIKIDESKIILDYKNNSHYFYKYNYSMKDDVVTSYSKVESKSFVSGENTYTVATEITLYNYLFRKSEKGVASGTVKIVTTHQEDIEKYRNQSIFTFDSYYKSEYDSGTAYTNDDFSYIYYTDGDVVLIAEDGLVKYMTESLISSTDSSKYDYKVEYLDKSVLSDKYDIKDYIEYTEFDDPTTFNDYTTFFDSDYLIGYLLCNDETFRSWFTITE